MLVSFISTAMLAVIILTIIIVILTLAVSWIKVMRLVALHRSMKSLDRSKPFGDINDPWILPNDNRSRRKRGFFGLSKTNRPRDRLS